MPEGNDLKKTVKEPVKNLVKEVLGDIVYRIAKAGTKRAINELKQELKEKSIRSLQRKLEALSERKLDKLLNESTKRLTREIAQEGIPRGDLIRESEQGFRQSFKEKLLTLIKVPVLKIVVVTLVCLIAVGGGVYVATDGWMPRDEPEPIDTIPPEVTVHHTLQELEPGQRVNFIAEAEDDVGIDRIELLVNGEVVEISRSSPCVFNGGPYEEGSTVSYSAYAYDDAGNRAWSGEQFLRIPVSVRYPDLVIADVGHEWTEINDKDKIGFCVVRYVIQNRGDGEAEPSLTILRSGRQVIGEDNVVSLAPGQRSEEEFPPIEMSLAGLQVELCVDDTGMIIESDEENNYLSYDITFGSSP